jgi:putative membrane protein
MPQLLPKNLTNELAKERNRAAAERTLMAWIRTCLSLISFGFGIDQIVAAIERSLDAAPQPIRISRMVGLSFIALGIVALLLASIEHQRELKRIQHDGYVYTSRRSLGLMVSITLMMIGLFAFVAIAIRMIPR